MSLSALQTLIAAGESQTVEFKTSFDKASIESLVAFANTQGGTVLVGVSDSGVVRGTTVGKETLNEWLGQIKSATSPSLVPEISAHPIDQKTVVSNRLGIDTIEVLQAAGTKWNFLPFRPGLVGGHCIGVDPYYLTHKALEVGYHSEVILAGRRINDSMAAYVADQTVKLMLRKNLPVLGSRVLVLGLTFKENCPDVRNTKVVDIVKALQGYNTQVDVYDPWIDVAEAQHEYGLTCLTQPPQAGHYAAIVLAVGHHQFVALGEQGIKALGQSGAVIYDVKGILPLGAADGRL